MRIKENQTTGIDLFWPISIIAAGGIYKHWIALLTCLSTKVVHSEDVKDSSPATLLHSFR